MDIKNHKTIGQYNIAVYATNKNGDQIKLGDGKSFTVFPTYDAEITAVNVRDTEGKFDVQVKVTNSSSEIEKMQLAVALSGNYFYAYNMTKSSENVYTCTVDISNHNFSAGSYTLQACPTFKNGILNNYVKTNYNFAAKNFFHVVKNQTGKRIFWVHNVPAGTKYVGFRTWSNTNGQDDLVGMDSYKQSDGSWAVIFDTYKLKNYGNCTVECYVDGTKIGTVSYSVSQNETSKNGWYYENGYKLYYVNGVLQTDVRGIIGAQSTYKIQVNRTCNTVTIYAKDGSNGYIIPVCAFACSVGLPQTPTYTGTYTVGAKYRWKMLMGPSYGQYATAVNGQSGVYFHSVAGSNMTSYNISAVEYNKLGSAASHGCIRLNVRDAKWIHDNVPSGSQIYIYDSSIPGPLGKPATIKISASQNWDPTDPNI